MAIAVGTFDDAKTDKDGVWGGGGGVLDAFESTQIAFFDIIFASSKGDKDSNRTRWSSLCCALLFMSLSLVDESSAKARVVNDAPPRGRRRRRKEEGRRTDDDEESDDFDCATQHMMR